MYETELDALAAYRAVNVDGTRRLGRRFTLMDRHGASSLAMTREKLALVMTR